MEEPIIHPGNKILRALDTKRQLYKYLSLDGVGLERAVDMIINSQVYFSNYEQLNDPFDCQAEPKWNETPDKIRDAVEQFAADNPDHTIDVEAVISEQIEVSKSPRLQAEQQQKMLKITRQVGIYSLSETGVGLPMWAYYGGSHTGICLMISVHKEVLLHLQDGWFPLKIQYLNSVPEWYYYTHQDPMAFCQYAFGFKAKGWRHEKEWRLVRPHHKGLSNIPTDMIRGVIFGLNTPPEWGKSVKLACREAPYKIKLYKTEKVPGRYELIASPYMQ